MADRAGIHDAFRPAQALLSDLAGWSIGAETIRRYCHEDAARAGTGRGQRQALPERFAAATGDRELHIDAGKVNTPDGYRDVKVAVFACRGRAAPAAADDYEQRDLPAPQSARWSRRSKRRGTSGAVAWPRRRVWGRRRRG